MSQRPTTHVKKPSGGRPAPKRLFSFDSLRKEKTTVSVDDSEQALQNGPTLRLVEKTISEDAEESHVGGSEPWTERPMVTSPTPLEGQDGDGAMSKYKARRKPFGKPTPLELTSGKDVLKAADDTAVPTSPGQRRWDTIRHHVLPVASGAETPPRPASPLDAASIISARPSTPKGYRFGQKRNVRQVVDEVRAVDEARKYAEEIRRACWAVRFGDASMAPGKLDREPSQDTVGTGVRIPLMASSTSLPLSSAASIISMQGQQKVPPVPKRPPSLGSLAFSGIPARTVTLIARAITATISSNRPKYLPHEHLVWSALLVPFLSPASSDLDVECATAIETFQMVIKTWKAPSKEAELDRCLWCCNAASSQASNRARVIGTLSYLLFPKDQPFFADTPLLLQTLIQGLISLLTDLSGQPDTSSDMKQVSSYITAIGSKGCGQLSRQAIEKEYGARFGKEDSDIDVRSAVITESVVKCLELGHENRRRWVLHHFLESYWPTPEPSLSLSPLLTCIHWRKLKTFISSVLTLLSSSLSDMAESDGEVIIRIFRSRILKEVEAMRTDDAAEIQAQTARLVLELLCIHESSEREYILMHFCDWYQHRKEWRESIHTMLGQFIRSAEWPKILHVIPLVLNELPEEVQMPMTTYTMPLIYERLVYNPPATPLPNLSTFLATIAQAFPKVFYKPMFLCAATVKESTVINQLLVLNAVSTYVLDLWIRDPDMIATALTSDSSAANQSRVSTAGEIPRWGKARVGQSALILEVIRQLSSIRNSKDTAQMSRATRFAAALETRLGATLLQKEQTILIPESQRVLYSSLFREIRLLTRTLKPALWLPSAITWFCQLDTEYLDVDRTVTGDGREDPELALNKLRAVYTQAQDSLKTSSKRSTLLSPQLSAITMSRTESEDKLKISAPTPFTEHIATLSSMTCTLMLTMLELLVCISGLLSTEDYVKLAPAVWNRCMDDPAPKMIAPACFLIMQCAEKGPTEFSRLIEDDLSHEEPRVRRNTLLRFSKLASWRFHMLSLDVILDRSHRRPFKLARPPILFVPTDIGSSLFFYEEADDEWKDGHGYVLPLELRRRLSEIGWAQEDREVDQKTIWIRTPMSLIPSLQLDKLDGSSSGDSRVHHEPSSPSPSPEPSPTKASARGDTTLTRQDSATSGRAGVRRRPVFVMTLISLFPRLTSMLLDRDFSVSSAALDLVMDFMRDDPALLARAVFNLLASDEQGLSMAITTLRAFLHARQVLPPAMAHHVLNHLTGFLKSSMKHDLGTANPLQSYAYTMPIIANVITQVSNLSMREIRRAKIDMFLTPTGALWFPPSAPMGSQFPRALRGTRNPFEPVPLQLVWITLIRSSQNKLFLSMLKHDPQDIKVIRKHMTRLVLPSLDATDDDSPLTLTDMLPHRHEMKQTSKAPSDDTLTILSATLARSYLLLICQVFQSMSRHLSDRNELAILVDGISRILVNHGRDVNIVAHCMIAFMTASTRFRRLFTSGGSYTLFMPAVIKVYVEAEGSPGIRAAIEYATNRFYALHEDSFVFQSFDVISNIVTVPGIDGRWVASGIYSLFSSLRNSISSNTPDAAGIQGMNKMQEKEALMMTMAEQVPQTFLASFKRGSNKQEKGQNPQNLPIPEEYEGRRLNIDNLVRLFLTVIAHNPGIQRAENFLRVLRLIAPDLYHASTSARNVLRDGIFALANILLSRSSGKSKSSVSDAAPSDDTGLETLSEGMNHITSSQPTPPGAVPADILAMRLDYLSLVVAYTKAGGVFTHHVTLRILEIVKVVLKDSRTSASQISTFITDYAKSVLIRDPLPPVKQVNTVLSDLAPIVSAYFGSVDFSGLYDVVAELANNSVFATEPSFATIVVSQYCRYGLDACEIAASENLLFSLDIRGSLLRLIDSAVSMVSVDVISEIEKRTPSRDLLAGIVLPFALRLKTTEEVTTASQYTDVWRREAHSKAWVHLLSYVLDTIHSAEHMKRSRKSSGSLRRSKTGDSDKVNVDTGAVMTFSMAIQVLKVIVIRAEDDISSAMPGIWARMGTILKTVLSEGDASFAFKHPFDYSEPPSPSFSPRASAISSQTQMPMSFPSSASMHQRRPLSPPRMIDYLTWSFIQWLWLRRNPLILQMRIFVQERISHLAQDLAGNGTSILTPTSASGGGGMLGFPQRTRRISAVFSKPRRSMMGSASAPSSAASTPRNSVFLSSSTSFPLPADTSSASLSPFADMNMNARLPGYARLASPHSPSAAAQEAQELTAPRIVHLGPVPLSSASRSPGGSNLHMQNVSSMAKEMMITSPMLVRATYRRIRLVQYLMGFRDLLPMGPDGEDGSAFGEDDHPESEVKAWTKRDALEAVTQETRDLLDEWRERFDLVGDESGVLVESEETLLYLQDQSSASSH